MPTKTTPSWRQAVPVAISGLLLIVIALYIDASVEGGSFWVTVVTELFKTLGIAVLAFAGFNVIIETQDWRQYIEERLKSIVLEQSYIGTLSSDVLQSLQANVLKAQFKDANIEHEGSFFNYFQQYLHKYIAEPYREDVTGEIVCTEGPNHTFEIYDRVTYSCRKTSDKIQKHASWSVEPDEIISPRELMIEVQYPANHPMAGTRETLVTRKGNEIVGVIDQSLEKFADVDGLIVITSSRYSLNREHFQYWQMAHPTKNLDITIKYPESFRIQRQPLVLAPLEVLITDQPGYLKMKYDSWMLPQSGLAWRYIPLAISPSAAEPVPNTAKVSDADNGPVGAAITR